MKAVDRGRLGGRGGTGNSVNLLDEPEAKVTKSSFNSRPASSRNRRLPPDPQLHAHKRTTRQPQTSTYRQSRPPLDIPVSPVSPTPSSSVSSVSVSEFPPSPNSFDSTTVPAHDAFNSSFPFPTDIDPPTASSLNSAAESEDLGRINRLLAARRGPLSNGTRHPGNVSPTTDLADNFTEHRLVEEAIRDQQRLEAAQRGQFAPSSPSHTAPDPFMIRRRTATGEEMVIPEGDPSSPIYDDSRYSTPERPTNAASRDSDPLMKRGVGTALRDFTNKGRIVSGRRNSGASIDYAKYRDKDVFRDREELVYRERERDKDDGKTSRVSRMRSRIPDLFSRKSSSSMADRHIANDAEGIAVVDWLAAGGDITPEKEEPKSNGIKGILQRSSSTLSRKKDGERSSPKTDLFQSVQRRAEARSLNNKDSRESFFENNRPSSSASLDRLDRRRLGGTNDRHSRISLGSPTTSRPVSRTERQRPVSMTLSAERLSPAQRERNSLRPVTSISSLKSVSSLKSCASEMSSSTATTSTRRDSIRSRDSFRSRGTSNSGSVSLPPEHPTPIKEVSRENISRIPVSPAAFKRAGSAPTAPAENEPTADPMATLRKSSQPIPSLDDLEETKEHEPESVLPQSVDTLEAELARSGVETAKDLPTPRIRPNRGNSVDSFLARPPISPVADPPKIPPTSMLPDDLSKAPMMSEQSGKQRSSSQNRSTGTAKTFTRPKSRLEDEDPGLDAMEHLYRNDRNYEALLNPRKTDEDDTFLLLGGAKQFEPEQNRKVRPKEEALAADRKNDQERTIQNKLMNKLKTLEMEVRSARRGINYIEKRLNGVDSSDESEWVDEEEADAIEQRMQKERTKVRRRLDAEIKQEPPTGRQTLMRWATLAFQLVALWFLLEIYFFYRSIPPSHSQVPINPGPIPEFGTQFMNAFLKIPIFLLNWITWAGKTLVFGVLMSVWGLLTSVLSTLWSGFTGGFWNHRSVEEVVAYQYAGAQVADAPPVLGSDERVQW